MAMRFAKLLLPLPLLGLPTGSAMADDLSALSRTIAHEPAYKAKPKYCLVVFGPEARKKMWLVLDGDVLYVDKNGNGDLTEKGKALAFVEQPLDHTSDPAYPLQACRLFSVGDITTGGQTYTRVEIVHTMLKKEFEAKTDFSKEMAKLLKQNPGLTRLGVQAMRNGKVRIQAVTHAADSPEQAPILHLDGPLTMRPHGVTGLVRGEKPVEFFAVVGTKGLGEDRLAILDYTEIPESAKPVVEIDFPGKKEKVTVSLGRC
jgi:hypothetical protein